MNFDAPDAPTHAVPYTRWWLWAALALALHLCAAALVLWWVRWPMQTVGMKGAADSEPVEGFGVQRLVWMETGIQAATPVFETAPSPKPLNVQQSTEPAMPAMPAMPVQPKSDPKPPDVDVALDRQPEPAKSTPSTAPLTATVPETATTALSNKVAVQAAKPAVLGAKPTVEQHATANSAPRVLQAYSPSPEYPPLSRRLGEQGEVVLRVQVGAAGTALAIELAKPSGFERLDRAAVQAVGTWRFVPAMVDGQAQAAWFEVPVRFELR